jgi:hypothetical protein
MLRGRCSAGAQHVVQQLACVAGKKLGRSAVGWRFNQQQPAR